MKIKQLLAAPVLTGLTLLASVTAVNAAVYTQCGPYPKGDARNAVDDQGNSLLKDATGMSLFVCKHSAAGDGWMTMADGTRLYGFGFSDMTSVPNEEVMHKGYFNAKYPAPTMYFDEGQDVYWNLTNAGMTLRPDLFDPHSIHWHGFPQASAIYDGVPHASAVVNMGSTFAYYYKLNDPGTFMYHCHVEATEHMQMGMLGNLFVRPKQNRLPPGTAFSNGFVHQANYRYAYNDGDGSTAYDVEAALQLGAMDSNFHLLHEAVQPLPFLEMKSDYAQINGRGYPMSVVEAPLPAIQMDDGSLLAESSQPEHAVVRAKVGQKILLRLTNLNVTDYFTVTALGLPMRVVGAGAHIARGEGGESWAYDTSSVTLGGGEGVDVLVDTTGVQPGTYFLYTTNLNFLSNGAGEDRGGLMTHIVLSN